MNAPVRLDAFTMVREATAADDAAVDAFVRSHPGPTPFHLPAWSRAVERGCGQRVRSLVAERNGRIVGVLPLTEVRSQLFGSALVSAGFAVDGGALGEGDLSGAAVALAERLGIGSVELRGGVLPDEWARDETTYLGFARDLAGDDDAELLAIPPKQRAEVCKALTAPLKVVTGGVELAGEHHRVYADWVHNLGTPIFPAALFREVLETMDADVLTVRHQGRAVASVLSLYHRGTVYPYWGAGTEAARELRANDRMYCALMAHARARGCTRFDFGRSKAGTGAAAFKKNWGFESRPLAYARWSKGAAREGNPLSPKYALMARAWRRLPLPVANLVGPWISRGARVMEVLFLAHRVAYPPDRGDKIRSYHVLRHIASFARVRLVAFADGPRDLDPPAELRALVDSCVLVPRAKSRARAAAEAVATGRPASLAAFADARVADAVRDVLARWPIDAVYAFSGQMAQYLPERGPRTVMDFVDLDSAKFAAYADAAHGPRRWLMRREARLLGAYERAVAARVDAALFVSAAEAALLPGAQVLENGIDTAAFDTVAVAAVAEPGPLVVFTGQMDYPPNVEAVAGFVRDAWPTIRAAHPSARFAIVGRAPTTAVRALAGEDVVVTGEVADTRPWLAAAAVVVAPLRLARGVQNKVLEAMAMARPVVASAAAAEGIDHAGTIEVADAPAAAVCALTADPARAAALGTAARARVVARYGWDARLAGLHDLLLPSAAHEPTRVPA